MLLYPAPITAWIRARGPSMPSVPREQRLMAIGTRLHLPIAQAVGSTGREVMYGNVQIGFPRWAGVTDWQAAFPWFYVDEDPGENPPEVDIPNGGSVYANLNIAGVFSSGLFDGEAEGVMDAGTWGRWVKFGNPSYTPGGTGKIRCACQVATNDVRPTGFSRMSGLSSPEAFEWSSTLNLAKIQSGGSISNNISGYGYGPCLLIGRGNDGRMVPLILGNSIDFSNDETPSAADARGNMGFWQRGFDDSSVGLPYINFASPGSRLADQASLNTGAFQRRGEILQSVETGVPFDVAVAGDENDAYADSVEWRQTIDNFADFINDTFGMPFAHRTMLPKVSYTNNSGGTTLEGQLPTSDDRLDTNTDLIANPADFPTFQIGEAYHDAGEPDKWKISPFTATVVGDYAGAGSITLSERPAAGSYLVFNAGTAAVAIRTVNVTSANGDNWNVSCSVAPPAQSNGATVLGTYTDGDGTHPSTEANINFGTPVVVAGASNFTS